MPVISSSCKSNHQSYGLINSITRSTSSVIYFVYYRIISELTSLYNQKLSHEYHLLSKYYGARSSTIDAYWYFGSDFICPTVNMERVDKLVRPLNETKIDQLFNIAVRKTPSSLRLTKDQFPQEKITKGVCFSFALHFITKFFKLKRTHTTDEAVRQISLRFQEGSSEKTGIIQGLQYAQKCTSEWSRSNDLFFDLSRILAGAHGGILLESSALSVGKVTNGPAGGAPLNPHSLTEKLKSLKNGIYLVNLTPSPDAPPGKSGHVIVYIKEETRGYLFDPTLGSVRIREGVDAEYLLKCMEFVECEGMVFYKSSPPSP